MREALSLLKSKPFYWMADVRGTPDGHPYHKEEEELVLRVIEELDISDQVEPKRFLLILKGYLACHERE